MKLFWIGLGLAVGLAVGLLPVAAAVTASPTASPTPAGSENVLFKDDFFTHSSRWSEQTSPKASAEYLPSAFQLRVMVPGASVWSTPDLDLALENYRLHVTAEFLQGGPDALCGVVLRYTDEGRFYALLVSRAGDWYFLQRDGQDWIDLTPADALPVPRDPDRAVVDLRVDVIGDSITLFVDDKLAGEVTADPALYGSLFGLIALAQKGYVDVLFDDMLVTNIVGVN